MGFLRRLKSKITSFIDRVDARIDKPAKSRGSYTQGSEQLIDNEMPAPIGRATSNRRSGFGRS